MRCCFIRCIPSTASITTTHFHQATSFSFIHVKHCGQNSNSRLPGNFMELGATVHCGRFSNEPEMFAACDKRRRLIMQQMPLYRSEPVGNGHTSRLRPSHNADILNGSSYTRPCRVVDEHYETYILSLL